MGLLAERAATRMGTRQRYRTAARMQRRRSWMESKMGMRQDFEPKEEEESTGATAPAATSAAPEPSTLWSWSGWPSFASRASSARRISRQRRSSCSGYEPSGGEASATD
jgi:hypothetical protein